MNHAALPGYFHRGALGVFYRTAMVAFMARFQNDLLRMQLFRLQRHFPFPEGKRIVSHAQAMNIALDSIRIVAANMT